MLRVCSWQKVRYQGTTGCLLGSLIPSPLLSISVCVFPSEPSTPPVPSARRPAMRGGTFPFKDVLFFPGNPAADCLWRHPTRWSLVDDFFFPVDQPAGLLASISRFWRDNMLNNSGCDRIRPTLLHQQSEEGGVAPAYLFHLRRNSLPAWLPLTLGLLFSGRRG